MKKNRQLYSREVSSLDEVVSIIDRHKVTYQNVFYRGQADSDWLIESTFHRWYREKHKQNKKVAITDFSEIQKTIGLEIDKHYLEESHRIINSFIDTTGEIENFTYETYAFLAQHYGLPTNLIDFTTDPNVALFFAFDYKEPPKSGCVTLFATTPFIIAAATINNIKKSYFLTSEEIEELRNSFITLEKNESNFKIPRISPISYVANIRLQAQKGCFLNYPFNYPYDKIMHTMECWQPLRSWGSQKCLNIPVSLKGEVTSYLESKGIQEKTIYPEIKPSKEQMHGVPFDNYIIDIANRIKSNL